MISILTALFFMWPTADFTSTVYNSSFDVGLLGASHEQGYGHDSFCWVSVRPLYSGEIEGLPLYEIFEQESADLVGYEFRRLYYTEKLYKIPECGCDGPRASAYTGYSVSLTEQQKTIFDIFYKKLYN
tara:strand:+ start:1131 stop:1514 length:384 start_codon:yes stop_codon:yes gene_type:complete